MATETDLRKRRFIEKTHQTPFLKKEQTNAVECVLQKGF